MAQLPAAAPRQARAAGLGRRVELAVVVPPAGFVGRGARGRAGAAFNSNVSGAPRAAPVQARGGTTPARSGVGPAPRRRRAAGQHASGRGPRAAGTHRDAQETVPAFASTLPRDPSRSEMGGEVVPAPGQHPESGLFIVKKPAHSRPTTCYLVGAARGASIAASRRRRRIPWRTSRRRGGARSGRTKSAARA